MPSLMNNVLFYSSIDVVFIILRQMNTDKEVVHFNLNLTGEQRSRLRGVYDPREVLAMSKHWVSPLI